MSMYPSLITHAKHLGYTTLLDAAALAPSTQLDLTVTPVDAVAVSFYKMFGYPTGIGALILGPGVGEWLLEGHDRGVGGRPWFAGGTVDVVQVPGRVYTHVENVEEAFEVRIDNTDGMRELIHSPGWDAQLPPTASDTTRSQPLAFLPPFHPNPCNCACPLSRFTIIVSTS